MSKLYNQYINLKNNNSNKVYLFKCGVFYYFLDADAKKISDLFNFKLLPFTGEIFKCSIPVSRLGYYISEFQKRNMEFEIIDNQYSEINNYNDYLNNEQIKHLLKQILKIYLNNITMKESYKILEDFQTKLKNIG